MVDAISGASTQAQALSTTDAVAKNGMGRDDFLKLLVAQLRHQDPLKPQDSAQFVAELAQFSSLEQSVGMNDRLDQLMNQTRGLANTEVVGLVGKQATVKGSLVTIDASGVGASVGFTLEGAAAKTTVTIRDQNGRAVRTLDVGAKKEGLGSVVWDGKDDAGNVQPAGTYSVTVQAESESGGTVAVSQETSAQIEAVSFERGYPVLHLSNGLSVPVSDLLRVDAADSGAAP